MSIVLFIPTPLGYYLCISEIGNAIDPVLFFSLTSINSIIGAALFFVTFWVFPKNINNEELRKYLLLTGIGMSYTLYRIKQPLNNKLFLLMT